MTKDEIQAEIERRTKKPEGFEFRDLHIGLPEEAYRMADKHIQHLRKSGRASFRKEGRKFIWTLSA